MINQVLEAREYLAGKNITPENLFRICYMMSKVLLSDGLDPLEVRSRIFEWGKQNNIYFKFNVNDAIVKASNDGICLRGDVDVWIGHKDVEEIVTRFDSRTVRCTALAMLCFAKVSTHRNGEFVIPSRWLTAWLGEKARTTYQRAIEELKMFGYLTTVDRKGNVARWNKGNHHDGTIYRIVPSFDCVRDYRLKDNNIWAFYESAFHGK